MEREKRDNSKGQFGIFNVIDKIQCVALDGLLYIPNLFRRRFYASQNNCRLTMMDSLIKEEDEDDEKIEVFMCSENRISDLPDYKRRWLESDLVIFKERLLVVMPRGGRNFSFLPGSSSSSYSSRLDQQNVESDGNAESFRRNTCRRLAPTTPENVTDSTDSANDHNLSHEYSTTGIPGTTMAEEYAERLIELKNCNTYSLNSTTGA